MADEDDVVLAELADGGLDALEDPSGVRDPMDRGTVNTTSCCIEAMVERISSASPLGNISGRWSMYWKSGAR